MKPTQIAAVILAAVVAVSATAQQPIEPETDLAPIRQTTGFNPPNPGNLWRFSPKAKHHEAVLRISVGNIGGSGSMIAHTGEKGLLAVTNWHVVENAKTVGIHPIYGDSGKMRVIHTNRNLDLAVLWHPDGGPWPNALPVCAVDPPYGAEVELCGLGGPTPNLKHVLGQRLRHGRTAMAISCGTVSGDSGGPMIWSTPSGPAIVGVNYGMTGGSTVARVGQQGGPWPVYVPSCSNVNGPKLYEVLTQVCEPYGIQPQYLQPPQYNQPPQYQPPQPSNQTPQPPVPRDTGPPGDSGPAGPPGEPGERGQDGVDGRDGVGISGVTADPSGGLVIQFDDGRTQLVDLQSQTQMPRRVILVDGETRTILDDETYGPDEPIVLDVRKLIRQQ